MNKVRDSVPTSLKTMETIKFAAIFVDGLVFIGKRHHNILLTLHECGYENGAAKLEDQGFVTNTGRFVNRTEAAQIALAAGQVDQLHYQSGQLFSEDLY